MKVPSSLFRSALFLLAALPIFSGCTPTPTPPYLDPAQPVDKRVNDLISRMTVEEKAEMLFFNGSENKRLKIPAWGGWNQCLHGVMSKRPTTLFPIAIGMAATWNPQLIRTVADAISDEARALNNIGAVGPGTPHGLVYRAPVINISRDPRWGRIQECYGEDPCLTGRIGVAYIHGLQGDDPRYLKIASTLKHFAVNNQETNRFSLSAQVPEKYLFEYYLPHWKQCVVEGKAQSVMAAYNAVNGTPCAVNKFLLTDILKNKWHFDGFVVSDLNGIKELIAGHHITTHPAEAAAKAMLAGCDYDDVEYKEQLPVAVKQGLIKEADLDRALVRVLTVACRLGALDPADNNKYRKIPESVINSPEHQKIALETARQSIVLLSNQNHFLPLNKTKLKTVAVIGPLADHPPIGNYYAVAPACTSVKAAVETELGAPSAVSYAAGGTVLKANADDIRACEQAAKSADAVILCLGTDDSLEAEERDRTALGLPDAQEKLLEAVCQANPNTVVVLMNAGPLSVRWAKEHAKAVVEAWYPGQLGGTAIADVLFGKFNPGGKLPYTVYEDVSQLPRQDDYDISHGYTYQYFRGVPVFPFGHGLSYTTFEYSGLKCTVNGDKIEIRLKLKNTGSVSGSEVAQVYIHATGKTEPQPIKKLIAFERVTLPSGADQSVILTAPIDLLASYDVKQHKLVVEPGSFDVLVGSSSQDIRLRGKLEIGKQTFVF